MAKFRKSITYFLCLLLAIAGSTYSNTASEAQTKTNQLANNSQNKIFKSSNWVKLRQVWKKINKLEIKDDFNGDWNVKQKKLTILQNSSKAYISALHKAELTDDSENRFLTKLFNDRLGFLEYQMGLVLCYEISMLGSKIVEKRQDLENRYDLLEKLYKKNKVSTETFELTKKKIKEDLEFIQKHEPFNYQEKYIRLVTGLNK